MANDNASIRNLINVLRDSEKGFATIGKHIKDSEYESCFLEESRVRGSCAGELEPAVNLLMTDADVRETGTVAGRFHRAFGDLEHF